MYHRPVKTDNWKYVSWGETGDGEGYLLSEISQKKRYLCQVWVMVWIRINLEDTRYLKWDWWYMCISSWYIIYHIIHDAITHFRGAVLGKWEGVPKTMGHRIPGKWEWEWNCLNDAKEPLRLAKQIEIPIAEMVNVETETRKPTNRQEWKNWAVRGKAVTRTVGIRAGTKK